MKHLYIRRDGAAFRWWWAHDPQEYVSGYYTTNSSGEGIFYVDLERNERKQLLGTAEFSVSGLKYPERAIRRWVTGK